MKTPTRPGNTQGSNKPIRRDAVKQDFHFHCTGCGEVGGLLSRRRWGWGYFAIVESFRFLSLHIDRCGPDMIRVLSGPEPGRNGTANARDFIENSSGAFPRSDDWAFWMENQYLAMSDKTWRWEKNYLRQSEGCP